MISDYTFPSDANYLKIVSVLKEEKSSSEVPQWLKSTLQNRFTLSIDVDGVEKVLDKNTLKPIVVKSRIGEVLKKFHDEAKHPGMVATERNIREFYSLVPKSVILDYIRSCKYCISNRPHCRKLMIPPFIETNDNVTKKVLATLQVRVEADDVMFGNGLKHRIHLKDPENKFTWAAIIEENTAENVTNFLRNFFNKFGAPKILETDNGSVFKEKDFTSMLQSEFPNTVLKNGSRLLESDEASDSKKPKRLRTYGGWARSNISSTSKNLPEFSSESSDPPVTFEYAGELVSEIDIEYEPESKTMRRDESVSDTDAECNPVPENIIFKDEPVSDSEVEFNPVSESILFQNEPVLEIEIKSEPFFDWNSS